MTVLITYGKHRSSLTVTRSLGRRGLKIIVGAMNKKSLTSYSRYAQESFVYPFVGNNSVDFVRSVLDVARINGEQYAL